MEIDLLEKTELWIENVHLQDVDLNKVASVTAGVLGIETSKVLVVDVRDNRLTLDILQRQLNPEQIYGKKGDLLRALATVPGLQLSEQTEIHSDGILGMIALEEVEAKQTIHRSLAMAEEVLARVANRACVFATGFEVKRGMVKDTNTPYIRHALEAKGFQVSYGEILDDDRELIAGRIRKAIDEGYGLVITTGGVGAESKDRTVEAILSIDPEAASPYIVHFTKGTGRHEKDGVRIAVGSLGCATIVALPGPNDEVRVGIPVFLKAIERGYGKTEIASALVTALREKLRSKHNHVSGGPGNGFESTSHDR